MTDTFALWDRESGNVIGTYPTQGAAYGAVTRLIGANGVGMAEHLLLAREDRKGIPTAIASGTSLVLDAALSELAAKTRLSYSLATEPVARKVAGNWEIGLGSWFKAQTAQVDPAELSQETSAVEPEVKAGNRQSSLANAA